MTRGVCIQRGWSVAGGGWSASRGELGTHPRDTWDTMGYGQQAGGTHPTGILSCIKIAVSCKHGVRIGFIYSREISQ